MNEKNDSLYRLKSELIEEAWGLLSELGLYPSKASTSRICSMLEWKLQEKEEADRRGDPEYSLPGDAPESEDVARVGFAMIHIGMCERFIDLNHDESVYQSILNLSLASAYIGEARMSLAYKKHILPNMEASARMNLAMKANAARHKGNREIAEQIKAWYAERRDQFSSVDAAAESATYALGAKFTTARKHIGAASKELRSARKA